jgi:hypothetical protein
MPAANPRVFNHKQLLEALVKEAGIHSGKWTLRASFGCIPGNFGPSADKISPGLAIALMDVGLIPAAADHPESMVIDAAKVTRGLCLPEHNGRRRATSKPKAQD